MNPRPAALLFCASTLVLGFSVSPAHALVTPFTGTFTIQIGHPGGIQPSVMTAGAGTAIVNGSGAGGHLQSLDLAGSSFAATHVVTPVTDPGAFPINGLVLTVHNAGGSFSDGGGTLAGVMPLAGVAKVCLFAPCASAIANLSVPLSVVGAGGSVVVQGGPFKVTVVGAPWTIGTASVGTGTVMGFSHGAASGTSSTASQGGHIRLVTPIMISTDLGSPVIPALGILDLHFVPEPTTLVLLASGIALLAASGRSAAQRR